MHFERYCRATKCSDLGFSENMACDKQWHNTNKQIRSDLMLRGIKKKKIKTDKNLKGRSQRKFVCWTHKPWLWTSTAPRQGVNGEGPWTIFLFSLQNWAIPGAQQSFSACIYMGTEQHAFGSPCLYTNFHTNTNSC